MVVYVCCLHLFSAPLVAADVCEAVVSAALVRGGPKRRKTKHLGHHLSVYLVVDRLTQVGLLSLLARA